MTRPTQGAAARARCAGSSALLLFLLSSCTGTPAPVAPAAKTPAKPVKLLLLRLGDKSEAPEPTTQNIKDGLKQGGYDPKLCEFTVRDVAPDTGAIRAEVDAANQKKPDLVIATNAQIARAVPAADLKVPVVLAFNGDPAALGLGKNLRDHLPNVTGAFIPADDMTVLIARSCFPNPTKVGIIFNPEDTISVAHKDAFVASDRAKGAFEFAEFRRANELPDAVRSLVGKKVASIVLVSGTGREEAKAIIKEATAAKVPVFGFTADHAKSGAVFARVPDARWEGFEAGRRAARVLKDEDPESLPFVKGSGYRNAVNLGAAKSLGITIRSELLREFDKVESE